MSRPLFTTRARQKDVPNGALSGGGDVLPYLEVVATVIYSVIIPIFRKTAPFVSFFVKQCQQLGESLLTPP